MAQQQVFEHEVLAWANAGEDGREEQPEQFKHAFSITDLWPRGVLPPDSSADMIRCYIREGNLFTANPAAGAVAYPSGRARRSPR